MFKIQICRFLYHIYIIVPCFLARRENYDLCVKNDCSFQINTKSNEDTSCHVMNNSCQQADFKYLNNDECDNSNIKLKVYSYEWSAQKNESHLLKHSSINLTWKIDNILDTASKSIIIRLINIVGDNIYKIYPQCRAFLFTKTLYSEIQGQYYYDCFYMLSYGTTQPLVYYAQILLYPLNITHGYYAVIPDVRYIESISDPILWQTTLYYAPCPTFLLNYTKTRPIDVSNDCIISTNFQTPEPHLVSMVPTLATIPFQIILWLTLPWDSLGLNGTPKLVSRNRPANEQLIIDDVSKHLPMYTKTTSKRLEITTMTLKDVLEEELLLTIPLAIKYAAFNDTGPHVFRISDLFTRRLRDRIAWSSTDRPTLKPQDSHSSWNDQDFSLPISCLRDRVAVSRLVDVLSVRGAHGYVTVRPNMAAAGAGTYVASLGFEIVSPDVTPKLRDDLVEAVLRYGRSLPVLPGREPFGSLHSYSKMIPLAISGSITALIILGIIIAVLFLRSRRRRLSNSLSSYGRDMSAPYHTASQIADVALQPSILVVYSRKGGRWHTDCVECFAKVLKLRYNCPVILDVWDLGKKPQNPSIWLERNMTQCRVIILIVTPDSQTINKAQDKTGHRESSRRMMGLTSHLNNKYFIGPRSGSRILSYLKCPPYTKSRGRIGQNIPLSQRMPDEFELSKQPLQAESCMDASHPGRQVVEKPWPDLLEPCLDILRTSVSFQDHLGPYGNKTIVILFDYGTILPQNSAQDRRKRFLGREDNFPIKSGTRSLKFSKSILTSQLNLPLKMSSSISVVQVSTNHLLPDTKYLWTVLDVYMGFQNVGENSLSRQESLIKGRIGMNLSDRIKRGSAFRSSSRKTSLNNSTDKEIVTKTGNFGETAFGSYIPKDKELLAPKIAPENLQANFSQIGTSQLEQILPAEDISILSPRIDVNTAFERAFKRAADAPLLPKESSNGTPLIRHSSHEVAEIEPDTNEYRRIERLFGNIGRCDSIKSNTSLRKSEGEKVDIIPSYAAMGGDAGNGGSQTADHYVSVHQAPDVDELKEDEDCYDDLPSFEALLGGY